MKLFFDWSKLYLSVCSIVFYNRIECFQTQVNVLKDELDRLNDVMDEHRDCPLNKRRRMDRKCFFSYAFFSTFFSTVRS